MSRPILRLRLARVCVVLAVLGAGVLGVTACGAGTGTASDPSTDAARPTRPAVATTGIVDASTADAPGDGASGDGAAAPASTAGGPDSGVASLDASAGDAGPAVPPSVAVANASTVEVKRMLQAAKQELATAEANLATAKASQKTAADPNTDAHVAAVARAEQVAAAKRKEVAALEVAAATMDKQVQIETARVAAVPTPDPRKQTEIEFRRGGRLRYGLSLSLLQFRTARSDSEAGRLRNYAPKLDVLPPEIGVQFIHEPAGSGWRVQKSDKSTFQLMSWGGVLLVRVSDETLAQGAISMAATLNFFNNFVGLGLGFDLYRGIPIAGADGARGKATAYTGLLSWAFASQGELTPENVFVVFTIGIEPVVRALSGEVK